MAKRAKKGAKKGVKKGRCERPCLSVPILPYVSRPLHRSPTLGVQFPIAFRVHPTRQRLLGFNSFLTSPINRSTSAQKERSQLIPFLSHPPSIPRRTPSCPLSPSRASATSNISYFCFAESTTYRIWTFSSPTSASSLRCSTAGQASALRLHCKVFALKIQTDTIHSQLCSTMKAAMSVPPSFSTNSTAIQVNTSPDPVSSSFLQVFCSNFNLKTPGLSEVLHPSGRVLNDVHPFHSTLEQDPAKPSKCSRIIPIEPFKMTNDTGSVLPFCLLTPPRRREVFWRPDRCVSVLSSSASLRISLQSIRSVHIRFQQQCGPLNRLCLRIPLTFFKDASGVTCDPIEHS
jgi:hypothetical protein